MGNFSLRRLAQYARYHYTSMRNNYIMLLLVMVGTPALFGIMNGSSIVASDCVGSIYILGGIAIAYRQTFLLRDRSSLILENTLPVSASERFIFMLLNLAVLFPLCSIITGVLSILIVTPFSDVEPKSTLMEFYYAYLSHSALYFASQVISSVCLMLNLIAGRRLLLTYFIAFVTFILAVYGFVELVDGVEVNVEVTEAAESVLLHLLFIVPAVIFYTVSYVLLRRRQVKW